MIPGVTGLVEFPAYDPWPDGEVLEVERVEPALRAHGWRWDHRLAWRVETFAEFIERPADELPVRDSVARLWRRAVFQRDPALPCCVTRYRLRSDGRVEVRTDGVDRWRRFVLLQRATEALTVTVRVVDELSGALRDASHAVSRLDATIRESSRGSSRPRNA